MMADDDDLFDDDFVEVETEDEVKVDTETKTETDDKPKEDASTSEDDPNEVAGLKKALKAERLKRQEAEGKAAERKTVIPDSVTDPDAYNEYIANQIFAGKLDATEDAMEDAHDDYSEMKTVFTDLVSEIVDGVAVQKDPQLYARFKASKNPAKFIYETASNHLKVQERSAPEYEEKLKARLAKELREEYEKKGLSALDLPDLTNAQASGSNTDELVKYEGDDYIWG